MLELARTQIGSFSAEAVDPAGHADIGIVFAAKPGSWNVFRLADEDHTHELLIVHESIKTFSEEKASWIAEPNEIFVAGSACGFFDLHSFQTKAPEIQDMADREPDVGYCTTEVGCLTTSGHGTGSYNLLLCYNKDGDAVAAKVIFIDEAYDNEFETYEEDNDPDDWSGNIWGEDYDFGDDDDEKEDEDGY
jgi:hypothetical protein